MKRVMVFVPDLRIGGGQKMAVDIVRYIRRKNADIRFQIVVLGRRFGTAFEKIVDDEKIDTVYLGKKDGIHPQYVFKIYRAIRAFRPDVIHAHLPKMHYLLLPMVFCGVPERYYTVHSLADRDTQHRILRRIMGFSFRRCHVRPIAISEICRQSIAREYHLSNKDILTIYNGIDSERFARKTPYSKLDNSIIRFIAAGRLSAEKNYPMMLSAFRTVYRETPNIRLTVLGGGELSQKLHDKCGEMGIEASVIFEGAVGNVEDYLHESHIFLMSSVFEGLPLAVLEAMAAGLPVISTKAGGVVDVVEHEGNGLMVDIGDEAGFAAAMARLAGDDGLRRKFSARSEELSKRYGIEACAEKYLELYLK